MKIPKKINVFRRSLTHRITKNIGTSGVAGNVEFNSNEIKRILICRPNHRLGNLLLITPLVQEVIATFPNCKIDLFIKGNLGPIVFKNYENVDHVIKLPKKHFKDLLQYFYGWISLKKHRYDIVINVEKNSSSGRLSAQVAHAKYKFFGDVDEEFPLEYNDGQHLAKYPVYNFRSYLSRLGFVREAQQIPPLNLKLSTSEINQGKKILTELVKNEKKTISLFTYATGNKCYPESWWTDFYETLKNEYPDYNIVEVLPIENVSQIAFKAPAFYSKDIREIGSLIANTEVFIGADSGMMHLASAAQTPTVGLFSVSNLNKYQPYNNNSMGINTNTSDTNACIEAINKILVGN